jgi:hypothetical protein
VTSEAQRRHNRDIARLGGLASSASHDTHELTRRARETFAGSFDRQVRERFPDLTDETEIARRASALRKLHYAKLARRSATTRAQRANGPAADGAT